MDPVVDEVGALERCELADGLALRMAAAAVDVTESRVGDRTGTCFKWDGTGGICCSF